MRFSCYHKTCGKAPRQDQVCECNPGPWCNGRGNAFLSVFQELQLPMLKVSAPELVSGVSGESEQKLRELFDLAVVSSGFLLEDQFRGLNS